MEFKLDISDDAQIHTVDLSGIEEQQNHHWIVFSDFIEKILYDDGLIIKGAKHGDLMRKLLK